MSIKKPYDMTEKNDSSRRRKWAPKARTGCRTCKTRHVKCDEARPICRRCILSGFRCDGYAVTSNKRDGSSSPPSEDSPERPKSIKSEIHTPSTILSYSETDSPSTDLSLALRSPSPTLVIPNEPYIDGELHYLQIFTTVTAGMLSRSRAGPHFWQELVPRAAWSYPGVRHAMLAAAISSESLIKRHPPDLHHQMELKALTHASQAVNSLLTESIPLDVVLLTSAMLGVLDLFNGEWETAITHITSGSKLADQARRSPSSDPFVSFYCEAFAAALPNILTSAPNVKALPQSKITRVRLQEAVTSFRLAIISFDEAMAKLRQYNFPAKGEIARVIHAARLESEWILARWTDLFHAESARTSPPDEKLNTGLHQIESPWSAIMNELDVYLTHGGIFDVAKFEIAMERTLPFYLLAKAGPNVTMRQDALQLMSYGPGLRARLEPNYHVNSYLQASYDDS